MYSTKSSKMLNTIHNTLRIVALDMEAPSGEVKHVVHNAPKIKPPRRRPDIMNKSNKSDYMKNYMKEYRSDGSGAKSKMPDSIKELRRKQRKRIRDKFLKKNEVLNG